MKIHERRIVYEILGMDDVTAQRDLVYKTVDNVDLKMDVYTPAGISGSTPLPGVLFIHGGPIRQNMQPLPKDWGGFISYGQLMAASGLIGVTFNHRFYGKAFWEQARDDVVAAVDYVREQASTLGLDPERLCLWVFSGGGPFISFALRDQPKYVKSLVIYYALLELSKSAPKALGESLTPAAYLEPGTSFEIPIFIARAGLDRRNINQSIDTFIKKALAANVPLEVAEHPQGRHAFDILDDNAQSRQIIARTIDFIKANM